MNGTAGIDLDQPPAPATAGAAVEPGPAAGPGLQAACPRCGHDLRGEVLAWADACPMAGTCPECGLGYRWADLLASSMVFPAWSVEGPRFRRAALRRVPRQLAVAALRPDRVVRELRLEHRPRLLRLAICLAPILCILLLVPMVRVAAQAVRQGGTPTDVVAAAVRPFSSKPRMARAPVPGTLPGTSWTVWIRDDQVFWISDVSWPPDRIAEARASWPEWTLPLTATSTGVLDTGLRNNRDASVPFRRDDGLVVGIHPGPDGRVSRAERVAANGPIFGRSFLVVPIRHTREWVRAIGFLALPILLLPVVAAASFVLLPVVRRRARVRPRHLVRLMLLALVPASLVAVAGVFAAERLFARDDWALHVAGAVSGGGRSPVAITIAVGLAVLGLAGLVAAWTTAASRHHLRLERPVGVGLAVGSVTGLLVTCGWLVAVLA